MATHQGRRRHAAFAGGLAIVALCLGFVASPATAAPPPPVDYVALGDSYTAGTGAGGLYRDAVCWQSEPGYVDVVAASGRVDLLSNLACHGALLSFDPLNPSPFYNGAPTVVEQIFSGQADLQKAELVSITAGAIDAGSLLALQACASPDTATCAGTVAGIRANLGSVTTALAGTYGLIRAAAPNATIAVMGYPRLFDPSQGDLVIPGVTVVPVANQVMANSAVDDLNKAIAAAVQLSGKNVVFVDVTKRFGGHAVNSADPWIVLVPVPVAPFDRLPDANFHPNVAGHQAYASALISAVKPAQLAKR
ncbi:SGNH/GDSL hydrolase family protein [Paenarthrobacter sp. MSM-2-10-13]|uniref:SGNH/GDSL hydrolase family protein n=1 Tax=Micrococcaceae TaxID=1268 RepID=UPI0014244773|nr:MULTISPECIES: SGNH/GDSL hydrolase family protein [Micrococcaceae]NHW47474.1 SGNH/GDSL hydrolase family protein [Paenarthrobacter sp. MSM-2-10-13]BCW64296.1 hydrolase [Arthrobacter sp. StoSoilB22]